MQQRLSELKADSKKISFRWDGRVHTNKIRRAKYVPMVGTWSWGSRSVTESNKVTLEKDRILLAVHEAAEKYIASRYGLSKKIEAHYVATEGPEKQAARHLHVNWADYMWRIELLWRKGVRI